MTTFEKIDRTMRHIDRNIMLYIWGAAAAILVPGELVSRFKAHAQTEISSAVSAALPASAPGLSRK